MYKKTIIGIAILITLFPAVSAHPDTPATLACSATVLGSTGAGAEAFGIAISRQGKLAIIGRLGTGNGEEDFIAVLNTQCNQVYKLTTTTPGNSFNRYTGPAAFDGAERLAAIHLFGNGAGADDLTLRLLSPTGATVDESADFYTAFPAISFGAVDDHRVNATSTDFFVSGNGQLFRMNDDMSQQFVQAIGGITHVRAGNRAGGEHVVYGRTSSNTHLRINATTGALLHTSAAVQTFYPPIRSQIDPTSTFQSEGFNNGISYTELASATFATIAADVVLTEPQINYGAGPAATDATYWDLDAQDNLLSCAENSGFYHAAKTRTSDNSVRWNVTATDDGTMVGCGFDFQGGFWVAGYTTVAGTGAFWAKRYTGGDFSTPTADPSISIDDVESTDPIVNPVRQAGEFFDSSWNLPSGSGAWLLGLAIVGFVLMRVKNAAPLVVAILGLVVVGLLVKMEIFPDWLILVIIFLIVAVAGTVLFNRHEAGEE